MDLLSDLCRVWTCPAGGANQAVPVRPALFITHSQRWPVTLVRKELPRGGAATTDGPKTPAQRHDQIKLRGIGPGSSSRNRRIAGIPGFDAARDGRCVGPPLECVR